MIAPELLHTGTHSELPPPVTPLPTPLLQYWQPRTAQKMRFRAINKISGTKKDNGQFYLSITKRLKHILK